MAELQGEAKLPLQINEESKFELILAESTGQADYAFSLRNEDIVATLLDLAARIQTKRVAPQSMTLSHLAPIQDYPMKSFTINFAERQRAPKPRVELKPFKGKVKNWRRVRSTINDSYQISGTFEVGSDGTGSCAGYQTGVTTKVLNHNTLTGEIETEDARYLLVGGEQS